MPPFQFQVIPTRLWYLVRLFTSAMFLCLLAEPLAGQSLTRGTLTGSVEDSTGSPLPDVRVDARATESGYTRTVTSDRSGHFELGFLPPGEYSLVVERIGFRPLHVRGVGLAAGSVVRLPLVLQGATPPVEMTDSLFFEGPASTQPGVYRVYGPLELQRIPEERREIAELARLASVAADGFSIEGLPGSFGGLLMDGVRVEPLPGADSFSEPGAAAAFPLSSLESAQLIGGYPDVEWSGLAGGAISAIGRRGTREFDVDAFGSWSRSGLMAPAGGDDLAGSLQGIRSGAVVSGPIRNDTASFIAGVEYWTLDSPVPRPFSADSSGREVGAIAEDSFDVTIGNAGAAPVTRSDVLSLFGGVDWQVAPAHSVSVSVTGALVGAPLSDFGTPGAIQPGGGAEGRDLFATGSLISALGRRMVQELRLSFQSSSRESAIASANAPVTTRLLAESLEFGVDGRRAGRSGNSTAQLSGVWYADLAPHRVKFGLSGGVASHERDPLGSHWGEFLFAGAQEFARAEGTFVETVDAVPAVTFDVPRGGIFAQDSWSAARGLDLTFGLRYDLERLPVNAVRPNQAWFERTGIVNSDIPSLVGTFSPRFGMIWDIGARHRWLVHASAGVFAGSVDADHLARLLMDDGRVIVRRATGDLQTWPAGPDDSAAQFLGPSLTLLPHGYRGPRSRRGSIGIGRFLGAHTSVSVDAIYRYTDFIPRRVDLNLIPEPIAADAFGRPLYGALVQQGGLLSAVPGSNRRFSDFDVVSTINSDGTSEYRALRFMLERRASQHLNVFGSYTYSRTVDDWLEGEHGVGQELSPFTGTGQEADWVEGTSSLDVPNRVVVGGELRLHLGGELRLAGLYRYESGRPFTPGFAEGVDANGDGSGSNDPAFISAAVPGMEPILERWDCLRQQLEAFAERNSCRTEGRHSLDLRLALAVGRIGGSSAEVFLDGMNLTGASYTVPDRALYRIDAEAALEVAEDGTVTVPMVANEHFGSPLLRYTSGKQLRIGLRIAH